MSVLDGPGEGTWSVFAMKVVEERDEARARVEGLRQQVEALRDDEALQGFVSAAWVAERLDSILAEGEL